MQKDEINEKSVREGAEKITPVDVQQLIDKPEEVEHKFKSNARLWRLIEEARLMFSLVKDYWSGSYPKVPWFTIAAIVSLLLYVLNPFDAMPDFIPFIGYVDDVLMFSIVFRMVRKDLERYEEWKKPKGKENP